MNETAYQTIILVLFRLLHVAFRASGLFEPHGLVSNRVMQEDRMYKSLSNMWISDPRDSGIISHWQRAVYAKSR